MDQQTLLRARLVQPISERLGDRLVSATYRCLKHEITEESQLEDPQLYIGGELHLLFDHGPLVVTWDENAGWPDHFSLYAGPEPLFLGDARMTWWQASHLWPWRDCIGQIMVRATIFADEATPHAVALRFGAGIVVIADGSEKTFGDGDDLIVRDQRGLAEVESWRVVWDSD